MGRQRKQPTRRAAWGGFDLSTTGLALGIRSARGEEAYAQTSMRGAVTWNGQPAFALRQIGTMIELLLRRLKDDGWSLDGCCLSFAVRQHDMVLLDANHQLLMPALSWQCNAATAAVRRLRTLGAEETVGRIEERFILPKLMWALGKERRLRHAVAHVMTTGDWIALMLTGKARLSTSDALSNGLLTQNRKQLAGDGSTTFNVIDFRGYTLHGWDHGAGVDPDAASRVELAAGGATGDAVGSKQADELKSHRHYQDPQGGTKYMTDANGANYGGARFSLNAGHTGYTGGNETRPTNVNLMYIIKATK